VGGGDGEEVREFIRRITMPHVVVKLFEGRSDEQKSRLTEQIVRDVIAALNCKEESVSVAFEDVKPSDWTEKVYKTDIVPHWDQLYKKPGYKPPAE
jgi:4-oxalocrotonate tautomerase